MSENLIAYLLLVLLFSCHEKTTTTTSAPASTAVPAQEVTLHQADSLQGGKINTLSCLQDANTSYSIYLPVTYQTTIPYPVVYFFDPHASGSLPLEKYHALADEFNWILIGSNSSKNGMQLRTSQDAAHSIINDALHRFTLNTQLQVLAGFSGGSKVACSLAGNMKPLAGLIACSGSYLTKENAFDQSLPVVSMAGENDFNYHEMIQFDESIGKSNAHLFISTPNTHEWPPVEAMQDAFVFITMRSAQKGILSINKERVGIYLNEAQKKGADLEKRKEMYAAYLHYQNIVATFNQLASVSFAKDKLAAIENSSAFKKYMQEKQQLDLQEPRQQQYFAEAFQSRDLNWWNQEIVKLKKGASENSDHLLGAFNSRLLGFLGIMCYSYSGQAVKAHMPEAKKFLQIYKMVEPENPESYFLSAVYAADDGNAGEAAAELVKALHNGFSDKQRFNDYPSLSNVIYREEVKTLLDTIH